MSGSSFFGKGNQSKSKHAPSMAKMDVSGIAGKLAETKKDAAAPKSYAAPTKKLDVFVNGENMGTGDEAMKKGENAENEKNKAWSKGTPGTEKERNSEENKENVKKKQTTITYTGDDAHKRINKNTDLTPKEKSKAKAKIRDGESYSA